MENFDNRIREKLEEVRPPLPSNAWANFKHLLPLPWYGILLQQYGTWLFGGLLTTGLLGSVFVNYQDNQKISKLNGEISTLKNRPQLTASTSTKIIEKLRIDTVYVLKNQIITKIITEKIPVFPEPVLAEENAELVASKQEIAVLKENLKKSNQVLERVTAAKGSQKEIEKNVISPEKNEEEIVYKKPEKVTLDVAAVSEPDENKAVLEQFKKQFGTDTTQKKQVGNKKTFKMPKLFPRIGLETVLSLNSAAVSPLFELFLTDNLGLSSGISGHITILQSYPKIPDFNKATGKDFAERYQPKLPKHDRIEEIKITTSVVRWPIYLKYYVPLKKDFNLLFSLGTSLDLSVYQSIDFQSYLQGVETYRNIEDNPKPQTFSNLILGSGLQYQRGRIIGQFQPFFDFNFKRADYKPKKAGNIGIKAGIFVDLRKR